MRLYNTLTKKVEELELLVPGKVSMYTCGPTVYLEPHIGNWRTFIFYDVLERTLGYLGLKVDRVMNITDVGHLTSDSDEGEDKLAAAAKREHATAWDISRKYTELFLVGMKRLKLIEPRIIKATDYIDQQIELVKKLEEKGVTYRTSDGIYFDTSKFTKYGELSHIKREKQREGARVEINPEKKNATDFAVWKFSPPETKRDMEWESPWGKGFPGWHLECSAIAINTLGETIDIHAGGVDHIGTHHPNEIAQSETATGKLFARHWFHTDFLMMDKGRFSKSLGNILLLDDVEKKAPLMAYKLLMLQAHYRSKQNFTEEAVVGAAKNLSELYAMADRQFIAIPGNANEKLRDLINSTLDKFETALSNDLDTSAALAAINEFSNSFDTMPLTEADLDAFKELLNKVDSVMALGLTGRSDIDDEIKAIIERRESARKAGDFQEADKLRTELRLKGIEVRDTDYGTVWSRA